VGSGTHRGRATFEPLLSVCGGSSFGGLSCCSSRVCVCLGGVFSVGVCVRETPVDLLTLHNRVAVSEPGADPLSSALTDQGFFAFCPSCLKHIRQ